MIHRSTRFLLRLFGPLAFLACQSCVSSALSGVGQRAENVTAVRAAYARTADFVFVYSTGPGFAPGKGDKTVMASVSRSALLSGDGYVWATPGGSLENARAIPVVPVRSLDQGDTAAREAVLTEPPDTGIVTNYCRVKVKFAAANDKARTRLVDLPVRGPYTSPWALPVTAAGAAVDLAVLPANVIWIERQLEREENARRLRHKLPR